MHSPQQCNIYYLIVIFFYVKFYTKRRGLFQITVSVQPIIVPSCKLIK